MATAWGGGALSTEPISSHAHSARTSSGERAFEATLMMVEEVADQQSGGKSTAEEKTAGGEAETERSFAIYRPGQLARQREEEEDRKRANAQRNASTAVKEASAEVANKGIFALQPTGAEAKEQPETARLGTITCELHANNTLLQCETIPDGGSSHTRMNASAMEPSAAEAVVKGAGGWVDVDMVVVLANGKRSCERSTIAGWRESNTCEPADLPPLREVQSLQRHGLARLSTREEGISLYEPCGGGYVAVLNAMLANGQKVARYRQSDIDPAARKAAGQRVQGAQANRNALGLRDRRSRLLFHVAAFIEKLEEKQPTGVG
eukprot:jgi/Tetstr1/456043/TSEL_042814.t1